MLPTLATGATHQIRQRPSSENHTAAVRLTHHLQEVDFRPVA